MFVLGVLFSTGVSQYVRMPDCQYLNTCDECNLNLRYLQFVFTSHSYLRYVPGAIGSMSHCP